MLTVLGRGYVEKSDFSLFSLLYDDNLAAVPEDKIRSRLQDNHNIFERIDREVKHGNIKKSILIMAGSLHRSGPISTINLEPRRKNVRD